MIPWRDHSFLADEDDIYFREKLKLQNNPPSPATGSQFYEVHVADERTTERDLLHFDHLQSGDDEDKNHILLFSLSLGLMTTSLGVLWLLKYKLLTVVCLLLLMFGLTNILLQTVELLKNEDTHTEEEDMRDQTERLMFLTLGLLMMLAAVFLYFLQH